MIPRSFKKWICISFLPQWPKIWAAKEKGCVIVKKWYPVFSGIRWKNIEQNIFSFFLIFCLLVNLSVAIELITQVSNFSILFFGTCQNNDKNIRFEKSLLQFEVTRLKWIEKVKSTSKIFNLAGDLWKRITKFFSVKWRIKNQKKGRKVDFYECLRIIWIKKNMQS